MGVRVATRGLAALGVTGLLALLPAIGLRPPQASAAPQVVPIPGVPLMPGHANYEMDEVGYVQTEYFFEGAASAFTAATPLSPDGRWDTTVAETAPFRSRLVVNRPIDAARFNGTVLVEWLNVSGGVDGSPFWLQLHVELVRRGYVYVGVSAQAVGLNQLKCPATPPLPPGCIAPGNPDRYGTLVHPGDSFSYDIFSQAGQAIREHADVVLGGLAPQRLIAAGESQSAGRLVTYVNAVHPLSRVYDGFMLYSRSAGGASLRQSPLPGPITVPSGTRIRTDISAPVLVFQTETDTGGLLARQGDGPTFRLWEVAGTAHFDHYGLKTARDDIGERTSVAEWFDAMRNPSRSPDPVFESIFGPCALPINSGPATFVLRAALMHMNRWIADGTPPPVAPRLVVAGILPSPPGANPYAVDTNGNVLGGIRTPAVDTPVARLSGLGQTGGTPFCNLFGTTVPLTDGELRALYRSTGGFASAWVQATNRAERAGFLVREDAQDLRVVAVQYGILR